MSKKFLVSLDLNKNELLNARLQNLSSDPSSPVAGQIYYNTQDKVTKFYDGTNWISGGSTKFGLLADRPAASKAGTLYVSTDTTTIYLDNGTSWVQAAVNGEDISDAITAHNVSSGVHGVTGDVVGTSDSQVLTNKTINDELFFTNPSTTPNDGGIKVNDSTEDFEIKSYIADLNLNGHNNLNLTTTNGNIILNPDGSAYIGSSGSSNNRIATIGDISSFGSINSVSGTLNQIDATETAGDVTLSLPSTIQVADLSIGNGSGSAITFDNSSGNIALNPDSNVEINSTTNINGTVNVQSTLRIGGDSDGFLRVRDSLGANSIIADAGLNTNGSKALAIYDETELKFVDTSNSIFTGTIKLNTATAGQLEVNATGELLLTTDGSQGSGDIVLSPDSNVEINSNLHVTDNLNVDSNIVVGGSARTLNGNLDVKASDDNVALNVNSSTMTTTIRGTTNIQAPNTGHTVLSLYTDLSDNGVIDASQDNLILTSDSGNAYMNAVSAENKILTQADLTAVSSGLTWKAAVNVLYNDSTPTLTGDTVTSPLTIDGHSFASAQVGYRVLITNGDSAGIYEYTENAGTWTLSRTQDANGYSELKGAAVFVMEGDTYAATSWVQANHYLTDFTGQDWHQFSGQGSYTADMGVQLNGTEFSVKIDGPTLGASSSGLYVRWAEGGGFNQDTDGLYVYTGTGLTLNNLGQVAVDTEGGYGVRKFTTTIGDNSATSFNIDHNFDTRHVTVQVFEAGSPYAQVETDVERTSVNRVTIKFASAPGTGEYEVVIVG